jgi:hypothetical protein
MRLAVEDKGISPQLAEINCFLDDDVSSIVSCERQ